MRRGEVDPLKLIVGLVVVLAVAFLAYSIAADRIGWADQQVDHLFQCGDGLIAQTILPNDESEHHGMCFMSNGCELVKAPIVDGQPNCTELVPYGFHQTAKNVNNSGPGNYCWQLDSSQVKWLPSGGKGCADPTPVCCQRINRLPETDAELAINPE